MEISRTQTYRKFYLHKSGSEPENGNLYQGFDIALSGTKPSSGSS
ncbi:MAG: hypothetical protein ACLR6J_12220 [Parabacteroides merdae]